MNKENQKQVEILFFFFFLLIKNRNDDIVRAATNAAPFTLPLDILYGYYILPHLAAAPTVEFFFSFLILENLFIYFFFGRNMANAK